MLSFEKSNSLICNFIVTTKNEEVRCNPEVDYAKWYSIEEAKNAVLKNSLAEEFLLKSLYTLPQKVLN